MVSVMEINRDEIGPDQARHSLTEIDWAQRAVRDTPWPLWLYPVNTLLLGAVGLSYLLQGSIPWLTVVVALAVVGVNLLAGRITGVPYALPTSRLFLSGVVVTGICLVAVVVVAPVVDRAWPVVVLSLLAMVSYALGSWAHVRSTRR